MVDTVDTAYEIAVCGGGFAGISAALAAARMGRKVILIEKQFMLGGLATAGLITEYLPLCDGLGRQVSFGLAEEWLRLSVRYGAEADYPENWLDGKGTRTERDQRFRVRFNPQLFAILAEETLAAAGVEILYGSYVVGVKKAGDCIESIFVENKSGRTEYAIDSVIDGTGDCDIAWFADAPTETFQQGNVLAAWYYFADKNGYAQNQLGAADIPDEEKTGGEERHLVARRFTGLDGKELSEMTRLSHKIILNDWLQRRKLDESVAIATIPTTPQIRMTRKIVGEYTLKNTEMHTRFETSIGMVSDWRRRGPVYEVPFETLYSKSVKNLLVAGRCTSVNETLWNVMRVIPCCAVTGQAAGVAAALSSDFPRLDVKILQAELQKNGVVLHEKDL